MPFIIVVISIMSNAVHSNGIQENGNQHNDTQYNEIYNRSLIMKINAIFFAVMLGSIIQTVFCSQSLC
jgi:hypothetical protein